VNVGDQRAAEAIPWEEIDVEIRRLVRLMNMVPGIRPIASCAGHDSDSEAVVTFRAANLNAVARLAESMPWLGPKMRFVAGRPMVGVILLTVCRSDHAGPVLDLRLSAWPEIGRWDVVARVEARLAELHCGVP